MGPRRSTCSTSMPSSGGRSSRADAVHPGFGFLAENADFAEAVEAAGIRWIGPRSSAIRAMGDKAAARRLAKRLGIPIVPGYDGEAQEDAALVRAAPPDRLPDPGQAGRRRRWQGDADDPRRRRAPARLAAARREALAAFGDDRLILERLVAAPRHVEVQLLFDRHGTGVHLGERDCSLQRRHQKVLEETPSPAVRPATRRRLTEAALVLGRAVGYESAGTCEFLLDDGGGLFFLEMNTRLQVEHPVTELVTGRDLVADQIRIAAGEPLGFSQADVRPRGHAIEVRLYAEDADAGFLPATGRSPSCAGPSVTGSASTRASRPATRSTDRFDPMLAKIVAWGAGRREAIQRLTVALDEAVVLGLTTNLRFLRWLVRQPAVPAATRGSTRSTRSGTRIRRPTSLTAPGARLQRRSGSGGWRLNASPVVRLVADDGRGEVEKERPPVIGRRLRRATRPCPRR